MTGVTPLSESWFKALLTLVAVKLTANILVGPSVRWRPVFISGVLGAIIICEYYYLFFAVMKLPRDWATNMGISLERWDCVESSKGGKRGKSSAGLFDINPCFCPSDAYCKNTTSGGWMDSSVCPTDGTALCWDSNRKSVDLYVKSTRDCKAGQGTSCTKDEPCTPCDLSTLEAFIRADDSNAKGATRCRSCGAGNSGACNFVLGEGPYCWKEPGSNDVEPCSSCCTEPIALYIAGTCY